jgi:prolyl-tRNA synthetase
VVEVDDRDIGGARGWDWIKKGIPVRVEIGPRDMAKDSVFVGRRDRSHRDKTAMKREDFIARLPPYPGRHSGPRCSNGPADSVINTPAMMDERKDFYDWFTPKNQEKPEIHGGFAMSHWCGDERRAKPKIKDRSQRHHPLHPVRRRTGDGHLHLLRQTQRSAGGIRQGILRGLAHA